MNIEKEFDDEAKTYLSWSDGKALYDKMHRLSSSLGSIAGNGFKMTMQNAIEAISRGKIRAETPDSLLKLSAGRKVILVGKGRAQDKLLTNINIPNYGLTKSKQRREWWTESSKSKRTKYWDIQKPQSISLKSASSAAELFKNLQARSDPFQNVYGFNETFPE